MKIQLSLAGLLLAVAPVCAQYHITGTIAHHEDRILLLAPTLSGACDTLGNVLTTDGTFSFEGTVSQPVAAEICAVGTSLSFPIFIEEGRFVVKADVKHPLDYEVTGGGELQSQRNEFRARELELRRDRDATRAAYEKEYGKGNVFGNLQIRGAYDNYENLYNEAEDEFIRTHDNLVSANLLARRCKKLSREKTLAGKYALLGTKARNSIQGQWLKPYAEKIARIVPGGIAPDLEMKTPEGAPLSIYGVKAKVKVLDFWASWCGPCRAENPNVRRLYEKYKGEGLEIISISLDTKVEAWSQAIKKDQLPWKHMSDLKGWNSVVADVYGIHAIPYLFVLDQDNRIVAEGIRGEELEKYVREALGVK